MAISPVHSAPAGSPPEGEDRAAPNGQPPDDPSAAEGSAGRAGAGALAPGERACASCGGALAPGQDWCLQCGAGAPGSLGSAGWRSAVVVLGAVVVLALGAAAAAYAALNRGASKAHVVIATVAPASVAPSTSTQTTPPGTLPTTPPGTASTPKAAKGLLGLGGVKPPKIPLTAVTPTPTTPRTTSPAAGNTKTTSTPTSTTPSSATTPGAGETSEESQQAAILLDPDAASTYNPYEYPASLFGDPSLAIDGDVSTAWTAQVNPTTAPKMAVGLLIDLKSKQKVSVAQLVTSTPGMTVQVYGTSGQTAPTSITAPAWIALTGPKVAKKKHLRLSLRDSKEAFTYITLWISKAPQSALGTAQAPGHVDVNELELFPTS